MALPIIPKTKHTLKSDFIPGGKLEFTPFTVGQQSILIAVKDSKDQAEKINAIIQIVDECIVTEGIKADKLPVFVVEHLFLKMRQYSLGESLSFKYTCQAEVLKSSEGDEVYGPCGTDMEAKVDLTTTTMKTYPDHNLTVNITETIGIKFKYPTMQTASEVKEGDETDFIVRCIDMVFDGEAVTHVKDCTMTDLTEFFKSFTLEQQKKVYSSFVASMPHILLEHKMTCPSCKKEHVVKFTDLTDFFA